MAKVLICGVNGFVGKHLAWAFYDAGHQVDGLTLKEPLDEDLKAIVQIVVHCDLSDKQATSKLNLKSYDSIVNLSGLTNVGESFEKAELYKVINAQILQNLGNATLAQNPKSRLIAISSGTVYNPHQAMPLTETSEVRGSISPYAASKLAVEEAANKLRQSGLDCLIVRPFNHIGPGQQLGFLLPDLHQSLVQAVAEKKPLLIGNLKNKRDFTDVRDVVRAYVILATAPKKTLRNTLYNVCSGVPISGLTILRELQKNVPGSKSITIELNKKRIRPNDPVELYGSANRLYVDVGWKPQIKISKTISDFVARF